MATQRVYLDHASAAPAHPAALAALAQVARSLPGDPSRRHAEGRAARDLLESARAATAAALGVAAERVAFTSGGTEAVHLAVRGVATANRARPRRILSAAVEHSAVLAAADASGCAHTRVPVDRDGRVDLDALAAALRDGAALVNLQHANHETGTLQPVAEAAALCRDADALLHVDACQTFGRLPVDVVTLGADLVSVSAAKFGGGRGTGALAWSPRARFRPLLSGDEREGRRRAGLEHLPGIAAMAETLLHLRPGDPQGPAAAEVARCDRLRRRLRARLGDLDDVAVHGPPNDALPHIVAASALYVDGETLAAELDRAGFAVHSGSSCASTSGRPSHVLVAMGALTHGHVRVSFGPDVAGDVVERFAEAFATAVGALRARLGAGR
ncbi:MAG TPA: aminotransferase class V-fold PLP-dependent enzyme [Egibacteraceae bacterium]|nr:aminotransferase class V-fold PLP-dependent enzyme [Egibacteraceae bacterium]